MCGAAHDCDSGKNRALQGDSSAPWSFVIRYWGKAFFSQPRTWGGIIDRAETWFWAAANLDGQRDQTLQSRASHHARRSVLSAEMLEKIPGVGGLVKARGFLCQGNGQGDFVEIVVGLTNEGGQE